MSKQPEALRLADLLEKIDGQHWQVQDSAAAELRRLHAENERLRAALAEPVQEPVAKVELMTTGGNAGLATRIVEIDDHLRERLRPGQLLYTHTCDDTALLRQALKALVWEVGSEPALYAPQTYATIIALRERLNEHPTTTKE